MHTSFEDPSNTTEVRTEITIIGAMSAARSLEDMRGDPDAYRAMCRNVRDLEDARDCLTNLVQQIKGLA